MMTDTELIGGTEPSGNAAHPKRPSMQPAPATEQATQILAELLQACGWDESTDDSLRYEESQGNEAATVILRAREFVTGQASRATQAERVQSSESIDTPEFRVIIDDYEHHRGASKKSAYRAIVAHIDARRATASKAEAPVAWLESEPSTRNLPIFDVLNSNCHTTIWHTRRAPVTDNPVWTVYGPSLAATTKQGTP